MKIAIFSDTFPPQTNGVANVAYQSAKNLSNRGHKVIVFTVAKKFFAGPINSRWDKFEVIALPSIPAMAYSAERFHIPFSATYYRLKKFNPDIIHTHTPFGAGWMAVRSAKMLKKNLVGTHHTFYDHYLKHVKMDYQWAKKLSWKLTVKYYNHCNLILSPTQSLADTLKDAGLKKPVDIIPNSIDTSFFKPAVDTKSKEKIKANFGINGKSLVYLGRVSYEKNIEQIVKAFGLTLKKMPNLKLMIIGDGPERENLEKLTEVLGIKNEVIFTGFLYGEDLVAALQANDVFLTASKSENMPLSVIEAMAAGMPIVSVKELGLAEIVKEHVNGFFTKTDDPGDMAQKIINIISDQDVMKKFSEASRTLSLEYSKDNITDLLEKSYIKTIKITN
jgi:1,2-diacylglycerol 3-alpha-glucosyltransferase